MITAIAIIVYVFGVGLAAPKIARYVAGEIDTHDPVDYAAIGTFSILLSALWPIALAVSPFLLVAYVFGKWASR